MFRMQSGSWLGPRPTHLSSKTFKVVSLYQTNLNSSLCHISLSALPYSHLYLRLFGCILNESGPLRFKETVLSAVRSVWERKLQLVSDSGRRTGVWALGQLPSWVGLGGSCYYKL